MLTSIAVRDQPIKGPSIPMDHAILEVLQGGLEMEPRQLFQAIQFKLEGEPTLQQVHARLRVLVRRGVVRYQKIPGGPSRGPGAGLYTAGT